MDSIKKISFPKLRKGVKLKKFDEYVLIYNFKYAQHMLIHPSHALILSLCNGFYSTYEIASIARETYHFSIEQSINFTNNVLKRYEPFIEILCRSDSICIMQYNPLDFIYNIDEDVLLSGITKPLSVPIGVNIILSYHCNFKCRYCYQNVANNIKTKISLEKCKELIREAASWGVAYFGLTGGEPTIYPGWESLIEDILRYGMSPVITTNGSIIGTNELIAERLSSAGLSEITVSLDASNPHLHHHITRSRNSFSRVIQAIRYLVKVGIRVTVKYLLTPINIDDLGNCIDFIVGLGVSEIGITLMEPGATGSCANSLPRITQNEYSNAVKIIKEKSSLYDDTCLIHPPKDPGYRWGDNDWYPCGGLYTGMTISPSGIVSICEKLSEVKQFSYGNVYAQSLKDIWNSSAFDELRHRTADKSCIDSDCICCKNIYKCRTSCYVDSMAVNGNYFTKHPKCGGPFLEPDLKRNL